MRAVTLAFWFWVVLLFLGLFARTMLGKLFLVMTGLSVIVVLLGIAAGDDDGGDCGCDG